ncbi:MAG: glycosyltransferase family 2 protein [Acidimicrobiales bacterium]|nr:glycosyltransferase family 2 protein [Acidimicrobiales bacterium]
MSVIVAVRNGAAHLPTALRSLLDQDPAPDEIVVVDGGSSDGSAFVARATAGVRVLDQHGRGLGGARNQGLRASRHELIAFCDADDRWLPGSLRVRLEHLRRRPGCGAVVGRCVTVALAGEVVPDRRLDTLGSPTPGYTPGALLVRRPVLERVGPFDEDLAIGADTDWFVRLVQSGEGLDLLDDVVLAKGARVASLSDDVASYRTELLAVARAFVARRRTDGGIQPADRP